MQAKIIDVKNKRNRYPKYENLEIIDIAAEGKAIARKDEMVIFVTHAIPGDIVDVQINKRKKNYKEGYPIRFHKYSSDRIEAFCEHFGVCGGCKWQMLPYEKQLSFKQKQVVDQLTHIGQLELPEAMTILPSANTRFYRNKLEYTFSNNRWLTQDELSDEAKPEDRDVRALGFHIPRMFDRIVDIENCYLQPEPSNSIRLAIKEFCTENNYSFFNHRTKEGYLRNLIIRTASTGEIMVILSLFYNDEEKQNALLEHIKEKFPEITSLMYVVNEKMNDTIFDQEIKLFSGRDHIFEEMEGLRFKLGPKSFYQTNSDQAYELYKIARDFAKLTGNEIVYDLYTGTGTIANFVASKANKVIGKEFVPEAIEDAKVNSQINNISNTRFFAGDIKDVLNSGFIRQQGKPDVIILDPPRAGLHKNVINSMLFAMPKRIVYISCNPATQARDIALLDEKYKVMQIQPVDMFPHTHHVENIVLLERRN